MSKKPEHTGKRGYKINPEFLAAHKVWRERIGEAAYEQHWRDEEAKTAQLMADFRRRFEDFQSSDEGKAREELRVGLKLLLANEVIAKSQTCIEILTAFHDCVSYRWGAADAAEMIEPLEPHFTAVRASRLAKARATKTAEKDAPYRALLRQHPDMKPLEQGKLLRREFRELKLADAPHVVRRWRESEEGKKSTAAGKRKSTTAKNAQKGAAPP